MNRRTKTAFGEFLVGEIKQAGISQEEFYTAVGIKKPYFYDLLTASPPPIEIQIACLPCLRARRGQTMSVALSFMIWPHKDEMRSLQILLRLSRTIQMIGIKYALY